ncbi:MAG: hypothetical protein WC315_00445 [Candidatus Omnitrophota bacterium]|jgi:hypothetical protein
MNSDFLAARLRKQVGLEWEDAIVWITKVEKVTEKQVVCKNRTRKPGKKNIVGYSTLMNESPNNGHAGCFNRRVFIEDANGIAPEAAFPGVPLDKCR